MDIRKRMQLWYQSPWGILLLFFLLIAGLKWPTATQPPLLDEAATVFLAAEYLLTHSCNVFGMLQDAACGQHWLSLMSLLTAAVMSVVGSGPVAWGVLHLLQWGLGAAAATVFWALLAPAVGRQTACRAALLFLLMPVTLGQLGCMYAEVALVLFSVAAAALYLRGRTWAAIACCGLACFTKESGLVIAAALGCAALLEARSRLVGVGRALCYWLPSLGVVLLAAAGFGKVSTLPHDWLSLVGRIDTAQFSLADTLVIICRYMPDHVVILVVCSVLAIVFLGKIMWLPRAARASLAQERRLVLVASLFMLGFVGLFWGALAVAWDNPNYLPRYLVQALPFAIVLLVVAVKPFVRPRLLCWMLLGCAMLGLLNRRGLFYPAIPIEDVFNVTVLAERSEECGDWRVVTRDSLWAVAHDLPPEVPVVCGPAMHMMSQQPFLGYVAQPLPNALNILAAPAYLQADTAALPDHFYLLFDHTNLGGIQIARLLACCASPGFAWKVTAERTFAAGLFKNRLIEVRRPTKGNR